MSKSSQPKEEKMTPIQTPERRWLNTQTLFFLLLSSFLLAYYPVWKGLVAVWYGSDDYSHGFFIIPVASYIVWKKKETFAQKRVKSSSWGLALIIVSLALYLLGQAGEIATVASLSLILALAGVVLYLWGVQYLRELSFPLFLLLFMIPIPEQIYSSITLSLQLIVSRMSNDIAWLIGLPIYREGNVLVLPNCKLEVVRACSGLRSMMSLLTLSAVFGYLTLESNRLRSILFMLGIPAAILINLIRVLVMILAFYHFDIDLTRGPIHTFFGVIIFILALALVFIMRGVLALWDQPSAGKRSLSS